MPYPTVDDRHIADYVLGRLPEEDAERLDEASIADDALAVRLRMVEDDLVDGYVRGNLQEDTRRRFEIYYLASPRGRENVAFARRFTRAVDRAAPATPAASQESSAPRRRVWRLTAVAAALLAAFAGVALQTVRLDRALAIADQQRQALDRAHDLQEQVAALRAEREAPRAVERPKTLLELPMIALVLSPQTRAAGPVPALRLPAAATRVEFELQLDGVGRGPYQVGLRDPAGNRVVWRSAWIVVTGSSLTVAVPARVLKPHFHSLDLFARDAAGGADVVASYAFEIASP